MKINVFIIFFIAATFFLSCAYYDFILVEGGTFSMGSTSGDNIDEQPVHSVTVNGFYMSKYEVTFEQYDRFCNDTGISKPDDDGWGRGTMPVINVSWYDAVEYCNWLSEKEGLTPCYSGRGETISCDFSANGYRLPTEAEWEFASRGGNNSRGYKYAGSDDPDAVAWYWDNSSSKTHPVGEKDPNELSLYDMSGNVYEWCWDWYEYYDNSPLVDPEGPSTGSLRVLRSGSWRHRAKFIYSARRSNYYPVQREYSIGFRLVRTIR